MGAGEIAERLGVGPSRAQAIIWRHDFPRPYQVLKMGAIWDAAAVERWIREHRPDLAEDPEGE
jgi:prophage regulatory protein